ncbi:MAG: hypothetical protein IJ481_03250 [Alphaproteobacteria bacterium]|nr:hypothetical protein [Alphaproteobacteria bacterium]
MSLYASIIQVENPIAIGNYKGSNTKVATGLTNTDYNYWLDGKTYVFNTKSSNNNIGWVAYKTVTIDKDYTLKLTTDCADMYYYALYCLKTFTNNGNVTIDNYATLDIDYYDTTTRNPIRDSNNNGTINVNKGYLGLYWRATLNNKGTITFKDSSYIVISDNSTLSNKGTIDISNITDLSEWYNEDDTFTLKGGSTFILPKSILGDNNKIGSTGNTFKPITLSGTKDNPVNIVIPKGCEYIKDIDNNNKDALFKAIQETTGFTFGENKNNVKFSWQTSLDN